MIAIVLAAGLLAWLHWRAGIAFWLGAAVMLAAFGAGAAKLRTITLAAPQIIERIYDAQVTGWLETVETRAAGRLRLVIRPVSISGVSDRHLPRRIRVNIKTLPGEVRPGRAVKLRAGLLPLPPPVRPGGFDFARAFYFRGLGAVGYALGPVRRAPQQAAPPLMVSIKGAVSRARLAIATRIAEHLEPRAAGLMAALLVGDRSRIAKKDAAALRASGLAHLLAISGLHMALMIGTLFWLVRALLAASPRLALGYPIKKWAALVAFLGAVGYLLISGGAVSTLRAFIMLSVMFLAIVLDRPAVTMRNLAIAALVILLAMPESLLSPGFQMSFATVTGLIALNEWRQARNRAQARSSQTSLRPWPGAEATLAAPGFWFRRAGLYVTGITVTTLVASLATAPIIAFHFQRLAVFGLAGNILAIPAMAFWVMPAGLMSLIAMPFGLEAWPLAIAGAGAEFVLAVAREVSGWPGAVSVTRSMPLGALAAAMAGGLWVCLWRGRVRWLGLAMFAAAAVLVLWRPAPADILIAREGNNIAVRGADGRLVLASARAARFAAARWLTQDGDPASVAKAARRLVLSCTQGVCEARAKGKRIVYLPRSARSDATHRKICAKPNPPDIMILGSRAARACGNARLVINRDMLKRHGAIALYIETAGIRLVTTAEKRGLRPWVR